MHVKTSIMVKLQPRIQLFLLLHPCFAAQSNKRTERSGALEEIQSIALMDATQMLWVSLKALEVIEKLFDICSAVCCCSHDHFHYDWRSFSHDSSHPNSPPRRWESAEMLLDFLSCFTQFITVQIHFIDFWYPLLSSRNNNKNLLNATGIIILQYISFYKTDKSNQAIWLVLSRDIMSVYHG